MNRKALFMAGIVLPGVLSAQGMDTENGITTYPFGNWDTLAAGGGRLFFALVVGVLLAFAFQWVLTFLSAATGLSAAGIGTRKLRKRSYYPEDRYRDERRYRDRDEGYEGYREDSHKRHHRDEDEFEEKGWEKPVQKIQTGVGLWVMITVSISSFFAAWCASELIRFGGRVEAVLIGLAVWAGFMFASMWMEANLLGSLMGNLVGAFKGGLQAAAAPFKSAASAMASSAGSSAEEIAAKVREEFRAQGGAGGIKEKLKGFTDSLPARTLDRETLRSEARPIFEDPEIREAARLGGRQVDRRRFQEIAAGRQDLSAEEQRMIGDVLQEQWMEAAAEGPSQDGAPAYAGHRSPEARSESRSETRSESRTEFRSEGRVESRPSEIPSPLASAETGPRRIEGTGSTLSTGPFAASGGGRFGTQQARTASIQAFTARFQAFKEFLQTADKHELNPIRIEREVESLVIHPEEGSAGMERNVREMNRSEMAQSLRQRRDLTLEEADSIADLIDATRTRMLSRSEIREHRVQEVTDRGLARLRDWAYGLKRPELDLDGFKSDFSRLLEDPKGALLGMKGKASETLDRETLVNAFAAKKGISRDEAGKMADQAEAAYNQAREEMKKVEEETRRRLAELKRASLEQAEATRRLAASAAWWLFAVAVLSGAAAVLGGLTGSAT